MDELEQLLTEREIDQQRLARISTDPTMLKALQLLKADERPTLPVVLVDPDPTKHFVFKSNPKVAGLLDKINNQIWVNRKSDEYTRASKDTYPLAALLAHEQQHLIHGDDEGVPYQKTLEVLERNGNLNPAIRRHVMELIRKYNPK